MRWFEWGASGEASHLWTTNRVFSVAMGEGSNRWGWSDIRFQALDNRRCWGAVMKFLAALRLLPPYEKPETVPGSCHRRCCH